MPVSASQVLCNLLEFVLRKRHIYCLPFVCVHHASDKCRPHTVHAIGRLTSKVGTCSILLAVVPAPAALVLARPTQAATAAPNKSPTSKERSAGGWKTLSSTQKRRLRAARAAGAPRASRAARRAPVARLAPRKCPCRRAARAACAPRPPSAAACCSCSPRPS